MPAIPVIQIPKDQLPEFKRAAKVLLNIVKMISDKPGPNIPRRDVLARTYGYESYRHLELQSAKAPASDRFELLPEGDLNNLASRLSEQLPELTEEESFEALRRLRGAMTPSVKGSEVIENLACLSDDDTYRRVILPIHQAMFDDRPDEALALVKSASWSDIGSRHQGSIGIQAIRWGATSLLAYMLDKGVSQKIKQEWLEYAIRTSAAEHQIQLVEAGARLTAGLVQDAVAHRALQLISHGVANGLIEPGRRLLSKAVNYDIRIAFALYPLASAEEKGVALDKVFSGSGSTYYLSLVIQEDLDVALASGIGKKLCRGARGGLSVTDLHAVLSTLAQSSELCQSVKKMDVLLAIAMAGSNSRLCDGLYQEVVVGENSPFPDLLRNSHIAYWLGSMPSMADMEALRDYVGYYGHNDLANMIGTQIDIRSENKAPASIPDHLLSITESQ